MPTLSELVRMAKYPFSRESVDYIKKLNLTPAELLENPTYAPALERAKDRIRDCLVSSTFEVRYGAEDEASLVNLILSYPLSKMLVYFVDDAYLTMRYASCEAKTVASYMKDEQQDFILGVAKDMGCDISITDRKVGGLHYDFMIHFSDYLKLAYRSNQKFWRLINRDMENGYVFLSRDDVVRALQNGIAQNIEKDIASYTLRGAPKPLEETIKKMKSSIAEYKTKLVRFQELSGGIDDSAFPPCIKSLLEGLRAGQDLPHYHRFALATFMLNANMPIDQIVSLFSTAPNFDENKTRYQVSYLAGKAGGGTKYSAPNCKTFLDYGICVGKDALCERTNHPLSYYKIRRGKNEPKEAVKESREAVNEPKEAVNEPKD